MHGQKNIKLVLCICLLLQLATQVFVWVSDLLLFKILDNLTNFHGTGYKLYETV
jgi:hypothetical protein